MDKIYQKQMDALKFRTSKVTLREAIKKKMLAKLDQIDTDDENPDSDGSENSVSNSEESQSLDDEKQSHRSSYSHNTAEREQIKQRKMLADRI